MFLNLCPLSLYLGHLETVLLQALSLAAAAFSSKQRQKKMKNNYKAIVRINNDRDNAPTNPHFANPALYLHLIEDAGNNSNDNKNDNNTTTTQQQP